MIRTTPCCDIFGRHHGTVPAPAAPTLPPPVILEPVPVVFHVQTPEARPLVATLRATSVFGPWTGTTDAAGNFFPRLTPGHYDLVISAPGFTDRSLGVDIADPSPPAPPMVIGLERRLNVRNWRGAFCLPLGNGRRIWTPAAACVSGTAAFDAMIDAYHERQYTHFQYLLEGRPYGDDYPYIVPDPERAYRDLSELLSAGFVLNVTLLFGDHTGPHWDRVQPMIDRCQDLLKGQWVFPLYEMNQDLFEDGHPPDRKVNGEWVGGLTACVHETKRRCPESLIAIHMTPDHSALGDDEIPWCHDMTGVIDANLAQTATFDDPDLAAANLQSSALRYHGKVGHGVPDAWAGCAIDNVAFELTTTRTYRNQMSEADQRAYTARVLQRAPELVGFGDGGE